MTSRYRILVTNDDGMMSPGLTTLVRELHRAGRYELRVVAPECEQSGVGHGLTLHKPLHVEPVRLPEELSEIPAFKVAGTPSDCVKIAITNLFPDARPDLVVSGINSGPNVGMNVLYSGTVAAALEACINEVPAIAFSLDVPSDGMWHFALAAERALPLIDEAFEKGLAAWSILNVNVPNRTEEEIRGVKLTRHGLSGFREYYIEEDATGSRRRFRLDGTMICRDDDEACDYVAMKNGWISVTPLGLCLFNPALWEHVKSWRAFG